MTDQCPELVLSMDDIQDFQEYGYAVVKNAFPSKVASDCRDILWKEIENQSNNTILRNQPSTWLHCNKVALTNTYWSKDGYPWNQVFSHRLQSAIHQICDDNMNSNNKDSEVRNTQPFGAGWWMITFPKLHQGTEQSENDKCETIPDTKTESEIRYVDTNVINSSNWKIEGRWHLDGENDIRYPYSSEVGIVLVIYFSDVLPYGGGTAVAEGSHRKAIESMIECGYRGITKKQLSQSLIESNDRFNIVELTGQAGDVILLHPLLLHARSSNVGCFYESSVRFMCHPSIALKQELDYYSKPYEHMSILERMVYDIASSNKSLSTLLMITPQTVNDFKLNKASRKKSRKNDDDGDNDNINNYQENSQDKDRLS